MNNIIDVTKFVKYQNEKDMSTAIFNIIRKCKGKTKNIISFPKAKYHVYYDHCFEKYLFIANHDKGLKRIAFPLITLCNVTIEGNNSEFIFHGRILPFTLQNSRNIVIKNLAIDYERPFFTEGKVLDADHEHVTLKIDDKKYPFYIENKTIHFYSKDEWDNTYIKWFIEFDPKRKAPTYGFGGNDLRSQKVEAELLDKNIVKFKAKFREQHTIGNIINITHEQRYNPGIFIDNCENVLLENIKIYHAGAMGIIGQNSKNISLKKVRISVRENCTRVVSTNNDATHFVNCGGELLLENCTLQHQLDDGLNVHGMYNIVSNIYSQEVIEIKIMHFQQNGVCNYSKGDRVAIVDTDTLLQKGYAFINEVVYVNQNYIQLHLKIEGNVVINKGDAIDNYEKMPEVEVNNCHIGDNRARGLLISTNKKTIIKDNYFYTSGSSIHCCGEILKWYESGPVKDLTIKNNKFYNCGYAKWGEGLIVIVPHLKNPIGQKCVNKSIKVINNEFYTFKPTILNLLSVDGVKFSDNKIVRSYDFKSFGELKNCFELSSCENIEINNNTITGFNQNEIFNLDKRSSLSSNINSNYVS